MQKSRIVLTSAILGLSIAGCSSQKTPSQKEEANKEWNGARASVLASLANEQFQSGNFDKARQTTDEALRLTPESEPLHILSAKLAIEKGQLELAERELKLARQYRPSDPEPYYLSGVVYQRWQKPDVAYDFYRQAAAKAPAELAYVLAQGEMLVALDRAPEALKLLESKVNYFEHSGAIRDAVGQLRMQTGQFPQAVAMFREASILSEEDGGIRERLAMALYQAKEYHDAADVLTRLVQSEAGSKRPDLFTLLGECQLALGKPREARYSFESASKLDEYNAHVWQCLGRAAMELGDIRRAEISLNRAIQFDPGISETHLLLGYALLRLNRPETALGEFQKASALDSRDTVSLCMIGYALQKSGHGDQAAQFYARALRIKPGDDMAKALIADVDLK